MRIVSTPGPGELLAELTPQSLFERTVPPHPHFAKLQGSFPLSLLPWMCLDLICRVPIDPGTGPDCTVETVSHDLLSRPCDSLFVSQTLFSQ